MQVYQEKNNIQTMCSHKCLQHTIISRERENHHKLPASQHLQINAAIIKLSTFIHVNSGAEVSEHSICLLAAGTIMLVLDF